MVHAKPYSPCQHPTPLGVSLLSSLSTIHVYQSLLMAYLINLVYQASLLA